LTAQPENSAAPACGADRSLKIYERRRLGILVGALHFLDNLQFMSVKIDLHCHSFFSGDGVSSPEQLIQAARRKGLNAIVITDHNTCDAITYLLDKGLMREDGLPVNDFLVVPGVEITTAEGHLLCIGAVLPNLKGRPALEVCHLIHEAGGLAIPPHPYDLFRAGIRENVLNTLPIDAIEVFNAASTLKRYNQSAFNYAMKRGLAMTAASDAHHHAAIGRAYTILKTEDYSVRGILDQIPKQNDLNQEYISVKDNLRKTWNNWLRLRKRKSIKDMLSSNEEDEE
jgi:predicted metal-dependent phosphoesterase TrpH